MHNSNTDAIAVAFSQWNMVLGVAMPLIVALIIQSHWTKPIKASAALFTCMGASLITLFLQGKLTEFNYVFGTLGLLSQTGIYFQAFWGPTGIARALEFYTTFKKNLSAPDGDTPPSK